jgi:proteasome assembly chaperone (PAC2) family protein
MDELRISTLPDLEHAMFIGAFAGWNDAASAASWALKFLVHQWDATQFAEIDPDAFYDFTETRPKVEIEHGAVERFTWPGTRFYYYRAPRDGQEARGRDILLALGEEPQLRWRTFSRLVVDLCQRCQVDDLVLLGALVAEVPHTVPVRVSGVTNRVDTLQHMAELKIDLATYEGPTGILSALQEAGRKKGLDSTSLWAVAPYYVSATPNLPVAEALLQNLNELYGLGLRLHELTRAARRFTQRVSSLVAADSDASNYVRELERRLDGAGDEPNTLPRTPRVGNGFSIGGDGPDLPSAEEAVQDVEAWLRRFRGQSTPEE